MLKTEGSATVPPASKTFILGYFPKTPFPFESKS